jgi:4'-phosphopantetheinyl transferase
LDAVGDDLLELLDGAERARGERILREEARARWLRARGLLRALLGRYQQKDPRELRFVTSANGKPALMDDPLEIAGPFALATRAVLRVRGPARRLFFNASHSGSFALFALSAASPVGVDVEAACERAERTAAAARAFGPAEASRLQTLDRFAREREFLRLWTRYEARLKLGGRGIGGSGSRGEGASDREPWFAELDVGPRAAGALALEREPHELRRWTIARVAKNCKPSARLRQSSWVTIS